MDQVLEVWGTPGLERSSALPAFDRKGLPIHSLGHLFSGLCLDTEKFRNETIVAVAMDAAPDHTLEKDVVGDNWYAGAVSCKGQVSLHAVESPGLLWAAAQRHLGLEPGSLMALASTSTFAIPYDLEPLLAERYTGGHRLSARCHDMVGEMIAAARKHLEENRGVLVSPFSDEELLGTAVGKLIQAVSIQVARRSVEALLDVGGVDPTTAYLSLSGGYALNCPTNSRLLELYGFRGLLTPPCANDSGQALGIGLLSFFAQGQLKTLCVKL